MNETVPWLDLTRQYPILRESLQELMHELMGKGSFILGPYVERFEKDFARFVGARHCVGLNSGTSALHLALLACGVGAGDEVITTPATWISTSWAISYVGARPVFVDIEPVTCGIDPEQVRRKVTPRTKAIVPVHLYGQAADMHALCRIADDHNLPIIEDACQAHAATLGGRHLGTFGRLGCFSFYPGKNLGAFGEAGCVVTDDDEAAARIRRLRDHAQSSRHVHDEIGFNMRMEGIQGAVLGLKLDRLGEWTVRRRVIGRMYDRAFTGLAEVSAPLEPPGVSWNRHIYPLRCRQREALRQHLASVGVQTAVHYPTPVHLQPAYRWLGRRPGDFPEAEALGSSEVTLPLFPELTDAEVERVIAGVVDWANAAQARQRFAA